MILTVDSDLQEIVSSSHGGGEALVESSGGTFFLSSHQNSDFKIGLRPETEGRERLHSVQIGTLEAGVGALEFF